MRISHLVAGGLILLLLIGAGFTTFFTEDSSNTNPDQNRIERFVKEEQRFQGIHFHETNGQMDLAYFWSYEPISRRFAAIYIPPGVQIVSNQYSNLRRLDRLYSDLPPEALVREVESVVEAPLTFWSISRDNQLARVVNLLGGIRLPTPRESIRINLQSNDPLEGQWMDGEMAMDYVSKSYSDFDIQGVRYRHKTFFLGLLRWLQTSSSLRNDPRTLKSIHRTFESNLTLDELHHLSQHLLETSAEKIKFPAISPPPRNDPEQTVRIRSQKIQRMLPRPLKKIIEDAEPQELIRVQVLNGAGIAGLAGEVRDYLQDNPRVDVVEVGNADRYNYETTRVIDRSDNPESAYRVLEILNTGQFQSDPSEELMLDVTVIAGRDLRQSTSP